MSDVSYLLEIVAKLRDEASPGIDKLKAKIDSLKATNDAENAEKDLGKAVDDRGRKEDEARRKTETHSRATSAGAKASRDSEEAIKREAEAHDKGSDATSGHTRTKAEFADTLDKVKKRSKEAGSGIDDLDRKMESLATRRDELNKRTLLPDDVKAANELRESYADLDRQIKSIASSYSRLATSRKEGEEALRSDALKKSEAGFLEAAQARAEAERLLKTVPASRQPTSVDTAAQVARIKAAEKEAEAQRELMLNYSKTENAWKNYRDDLNSGDLSKGEAARGLKEFSSQFTTLRRNLIAGRQDLGDTDKYIDDIASKLKNTDLASTGGLFRSSVRSTSGGAGKNEISEVIDSINSKIGDVGIRITGVASALTGFFDLAKIGFSQQLLTGVTSFAGGLLAVGSAAVQAGAGLAGAFISGLGQAIPMLAIVAASLERFKNILQAVSIAGQAEQQHFYDPTEKQVLQLQQSSQIVSANQQLSNSYIQLFEAQQRVRDSQIALTEARYTAKRQITELSMAEKDARLQAEGANLSLAESRRQLQIAIQKGDTAGLAQAELAIKEAELGKQKAEYAVPKTEREARLARQRGVSGAPGVISAVEGLEGAKVAQLQAQQAGEAAKRQKQITELQQAARSSKETQYESQLKYAEKGMSPTELGLTNALIGIEKELKSPDSPLKKITDYFVEPFTNAIEKIRSLLKTSSFLEPIDELAKSMGEGLSRLEKATYGPQGTTFFEQMSKDATANVPIISQVIERIMKLFEDIANAASPAFHKLSKDWDEFWGKLNRKYEGNGLEKLTDFFNKSVVYAEHFAELGKALFGLFESIGKDAAPQGDKTITSFTEAIKEATGWVQSHGPEVTKFFKEAREGLSILGNMFFGIGKSIIQVFSLTSLKAFNGFLQELVLPGLKDVVNTLGFLTNKVLEFFNLFGGPGRKILEVIGADGVIVVGIVKIIKLVEELKKAWIVLTALFEEEGILASLNPIMLALIGIGVTIAAVFGAFSGAQKKNKISTEEVTQALENQANVMRTLKDLSAEYKSSELGVKESRLAEKSAQQSLVRTEREKVVPGEGETAAEAAEGHKLRIEQARQDVTRSKLEREETEKKFRELPSEQKEIAEKGRRESVQNVGVQRTAQEQKISSLEKSIRETKGFMAEPTVGGEPRTARQRKSEIEGLAYEEKQLAKAKEELTKVNEKGAQSIKVANKEIARSNSELVGEAPNINKAYSEAFSKFEDSVKRGTSAAHSGMGKIRELVNNALKKYGVTPAELSGASSAATNVVRGAAGAAGAVSKGLGFAAGEFVEPRSGGVRANIAEAGYGEAVLSTDPAHAQRSRAILGKYFSRAPHMATGGFVADPGTNFTVNQEPKIVTELRKLGEYLHTTIYGISGYRSPQHSTEVGGFADDPHTRGEAADIGVGNNTLESASKLTASILAKFNLYRPFYPASAHEINHVQLLPGSMANIAGSLASGSALSSSAQKNIVAEISSPKVKGGGAIGQIAQGALNLATKAANIYLAKFASPEEASGNAHLSGGNVGSEVMNFFTGKSLSKIAASGIVGNFQQESSLNPKEAGGGLDQGQGDRDFSSRSLAGQLAGIWGELTGDEKGTLEALRRAKSPAEAARIFSEKFERPGVPEIANREKYAEEAYRQYATGGMVGDSVRRLAVRHLRKKILKFAQGGRAPWGGKPVPIIAHEGERIMNPAQYSETARLAGTSPGGLDRHLGYDGSPHQSFAAGGIPKALQHIAHPGGTAQPISGSNFESFIPTELEVGTLNDIVKVFKKLKQGFKNLKKVTGKQYLSDLTKVVQEIIIETSGTLARLQEGREYFKAKLQRSSVQKEYSVKGNQVSLGVQGQAGIDVQNLNILNEEAKYLEEERNIIKLAQQQAEKIKNPTSRKNALNSLKIKQKEFDEAIDTNIEARYQAAIQAFQDGLNIINANYQIESQKLTNAQSLAQNMGNLSAANQIDEQIKSAAEAQYHVLGSKLEEAGGTGDQELINSIKQEMTSLEATIFGEIAERISNQQTLIQRESQQRESQVSTRLGFSKILSQEGRYEAAGREEKSGLLEKQASLLSTKSQEEQLREQAIREGDTAAVITLGEELSKNSLEIAENNLALKENAVVTREFIVSQIEATGQFKSGVYSAATQGLEILAKTTGYTNVGGLLSAAKGREGSYGTERSELEKQAGGIGLGVEGMTPAQILTYLASPAGQSKLAELEKNEDKAEKEQMYKLVQALETNSINTLKNAEEIAKLNGQLNQPQYFSTTSWQQMRGAFFNGMGGLLPQYASALPPGALAEMPKYGEMAPGASRAAPTIGQLNMTHPVERLDPVVFGEQLSHIISTTPSMQ